MDKLRRENLFGASLVPVKGSLVERYNQCLRIIGKSPTELTEFYIDGIGWSPEIAEEKEDTNYLNNGDANPNAIIITPTQKGKPVYTPFHSFDKQIMDLIFENYGGSINDITKDGGICVDLDQYIDAFYEPFDLLKYQNISIGFKLINDLDEIQQKQNDLIALFKKDNNFVDQEIHMQLLASARKYGDLRSRRLTLEPLVFKTSSFYTRAFGGVFVIKDYSKPILIFESDKWYKEAIQDTTLDVIIYRIDEKDLVQQLLGHRILRYNLLNIEETERYMRIKNFFFVERLKNIEHNVSEILNNQILYKSYLNKLEIQDRKVVMGVELFNEKQRINQQTEIFRYIDFHFFNALCEPNIIFKDEEEELIWKLLTKIAPKDPLHLYWYNKEAFYQQYQTWDATYQDWIITYIKEKGG